MPDIKQNISLRSFNTFGIDVKAKYFVRITSIQDLQQLIKTEIYQNERRLALGGGSNVLFTRDFDGLIIQIDIKGIHKLKENEAHVTVKAGAGEHWHQFVMHCVNNNWGGVENLSLIPGTVGAAPIQNIGAYGIEVKEVIEEVEYLDALTGEVKTLHNDKCHFGYRQSVFKRQLKEKFFISSVTLTLTKKNHLIRTEYGAIREMLQQHKIQVPTIRDVSDAVIEIRKSKLPDPTTIGNAGSFFKNPSIALSEYQTLKMKHPEIPGYTSVNQEVKVPAAWLIEQCGWKGKRIHNIGVHKTQPLVLVNYGGGNGEEIFQLAQQIQRSVVEKFGINLTTEVNIF